jgi:hypothetical protein
MNRLTGLVIGLLVISGCAVASADAGVVVTDTPPVRVSGVTFAEFDTSLAPYGDWITVGGYGRVWRPSVAVVGVGFRPYATGGHWVSTNYGWSFESDWNWGWAPFHYGRWAMDPVYGWVWVPDTTWGPSWVSWRFGGGYVGWAPLAPFGSTVVIESYHPAWCFVQSPYFLHANVWQYSLPYERVHIAFAASVPLRASVAFGSVSYYSGPPVAHISAVVGRPITPVYLNAPRPGVVQSIHVSAVGQPVYGTPVARGPVVGTPVSGRPVVGTPVSGRPVVGTPVSGRPVVGAPVAAPVTGRPVVAAPVTGRPVVAPSAPLTGRPVGSPMPARPVVAAPVMNAHPVYAAPRPMAAAPVRSAPVAPTYRAAPVTRAPAVARPVAAAPVRGLPVPHR